MRKFNGKIKGYRVAIEFVHEGETYTFMTEPNDMNDNQMWWFDPQPTMYAGDVGGAKAIAKNILKAGGKSLDIKGL